MRRPSVEVFWIGNSSIKIYWCKLLIGETEKIVTMGEECEEEQDITDFVHLDPDMIRLLASRIEEIKNKLFSGYENE